MPGPPPKDPDKRQRRNPEIPMSTIVGEPAPAPKLGDRARLLPETKRWWDVWARSPQSTTFLTTDWDHLLMLVPLVNEFYSKPSAALYTAILSGEAKLGKTPADRQRLRLKVVPAERAIPAKGAARSDPRQLHAVRDSA